MLPTVNEIENFREDVGVYISEKVASELFMQCSISKDKIGYLSGDIQFYKGVPYALITGSFSDVDKIDYLDDEVMVVGWYYCGSESPYEGKGADVERRLLSRPHHVTLAINSDKRQINAYKRVGKEFVNALFLMTTFQEIAKETFSDEVLIEDEIVEVREAGKMLEFIAFSFISILFGIFGGLLGFFIGDDQGMKKRVLFVIFGVMSTIFWLMLGRSIL
jgi:hypothetical protein